MKITLEVSEENESTDSPYWMILDPKQNMSLNVHMLASMLTGPFFSRAEAEEFLKRTKYNFSKRAVVYGCSGTYSDQYRDACRSALAGAPAPSAPNTIVLK